MNRVIVELQKLTNCASQDPLILIGYFHKKYPKKNNVIIALNDFFFNENIAEKITENDMLQILNN